MMRGAHFRSLFLLALASSLSAQTPCDDPVTPHIRIDDGHRWRPPFGLDRVGKPVTAVVDLAADRRPVREYYLSGLKNGKETERRVLNLNAGKGDFTDTVAFPSHPDELVLSAKCRYQGQETELLRQKVEYPELEADATAKPDKLINPVDLGAILLPEDWLILAANQRAVIEVAAISYRLPVHGARLQAWFESTRKAVASAELSLEPNERVTRRLETDPVTSGPEQTRS